MYRDLAFLACASCHVCMLVVRDTATSNVHYIVLISFLSMLLGTHTVNLSMYHTKERSTLPASQVCSAALGCHPHCTQKCFHNASLHLNANVHALLV
jgi:hypothetical protein